MPEVLAKTASGSDTLPWWGNIAVALGVLLMAWANWRYIERLTAACFGERHAQWLARSPIGNKIGGTVFLVAVGLALLVAGIAQLAMEVLG